MVQRRQREAIAREAVDGIAIGVALLPQTGERSRRCHCRATSLRQGWWRCAPTALARSTPKPTCVGTTTTPSPARLLLARPT